MAHYLAKFGIGLLVLTGYVLFCWGVFISPNASFFISTISLTISILNSAGLIALWVFYLSKQFSTHKVQVMDIKKSVLKKTPVMAPDFDLEDEDERELKDFASSTSAALFNRTKERMTDSLT